MSVADQTMPGRKSVPALADPFAELYARSRAAEFAFAPEQFLQLLKDVALKHASGEAREKLYDVARQITREDASGRELADCLYTDLYGTKVRGEERVSKLSFYSGRGSLDGWLRTVLAQEYVNTYRKQRRLISLDEESEEGVQFAAPVREDAPSADPALVRATDEALRTLAAEDRFVLSSYFLDDRTLAHVAQTLGVHESTISRKVEKLTTNLRKQILKNLMKLGLSRRQAEEALSADVRDLALDIRASLAQDSLPGAFSEKGAKAGEGRR
jgi:RNA polymerase sigma-70 factor (ECF subfamily)